MINAERKKDRKKWRKNVEKFLYCIFILSFYNYKPALTTSDLFLLSNIVLKYVQVNHLIPYCFILWIIMEVNFLPFFNLFSSHKSIILESVSLVPSVPFLSEVWLLLLGAWECFSSFSGLSLGRKQLSTYSFLLDFKTWNWALLVDY